MKIEIKAVNERRCRAGRCFTAIPEYFDPDDFSEEGWKAIEDDPMLAVRRVEEDEIEERPALGGPEAEVSAIDAAIRLLAASQFDGSGNPRMPALRDALKSATPELSASLDVATRDRVFATMIAGGFTVPVA